MTNEEAIKLLNQEKIPMILDGKPNEHLAVTHIKAIEALEENTRLKSEIEQLKLYATSLINTRNLNEETATSIRQKMQRELIMHEEIEQLKSELYQLTYRNCLQCFNYGKCSIFDNYNITNCSDFELKGGNNDSKI